MSQEPSEPTRQSAGQTRLIAEQRQTISELQTPVIEVWEGILALPIIGSVDTARAQTRSMRASSSGQPRWPSIMPTVRKLAIGFATFLPTSCGAEPCTGSNIATRFGSA